MLSRILEWTSSQLACLIARKLALRSATNSWYVSLWFITPFCFTPDELATRAEGMYSSKKAFGSICFSARFTWGVLWTRSFNGLRDLTVTAYCRRKCRFLHQAVWKQSEKKVYNIEFWSFSNNKKLPRYSSETLSILQQWKRKNKSLFPGLKEKIEI